MKKRWLIFLFFIGISTVVVSQKIALDFYLIDNTTKQGIPNTNIFLVNTTYGGITDKMGRVQLEIPQKIAEDLLISHINYDTKLLEQTDYQRLSNGDTIYLSPNNIDLSEIVVTAKRNNQWKKHYKKFKKVFLGKGKPAEKCAILNPEVLQFEEKNGNLIATALDLIQIKNDYLGYEIKYLLTAFELKENGSSIYSGKASYKDLWPTNETEKLKVREETYLNSSKYFFFSLINNQLNENGFTIENVHLEDGYFNLIDTPTRDSLMVESTDSTIYLLDFPEFLKVVNRNKKELEISKVGISSFGAESAKFSGTLAEDKVKIDYETSYLYKVAPYLQLNEFGNILNTQSVKEYGAWANQRMALQLPFDFGNTYQMDYLAEISTAKTQAVIKDSAKSKSKQISDNQKLKLFTTLIYENNPTLKTQILAQVEKIWEPAFIPILIEYIRLNSDKKFVEEVADLLSQKTNQNFGLDHLSWLEWLWKNDPTYAKYQGNFIAEYYQNIDPRFRKYFKDRQPTAKIRLDEIVWGGVKQDGIPPLRQPELLSAKAAKYLADTDIVFGLYLNGVAKAYPKRILAWHEFFTDTFGETKVAGVYCTLCGTVIGYNMVANGVFHDLGTSGFLYRSNKLMYDKETQSLWSTIQGAPVLGPLVDKGISLETFPVETTTWGQWKKRHPTTKVLSLETGHERDYSEGAAYASYFGTDDLMFPVPIMDDYRLHNKSEVLIIRAPDYQKDPLAISINHLKKKKWLQGKIGSTNFVAIADKTGAARAYELGNIKMISYKKGQFKDDSGQVWKVTNDGIISTDNQPLKQIPSHNIFWFAWLNAYPSTRLVK